MTSIGIDLGTTYSCVAVYKNNKVEIIANEHGHLTTPSYVSFVDDNINIGYTAKNNANLNPLNTICDAKRFIGKNFTDETVQKDKKLLQFYIKNDNEDNIVFNVNKNLYTPQKISSLILNYIKIVAEKYLDEKVESAVITVPAYFNDAQRSATKTAGEMAGLKVLRIINEPTAAALAYGLDKNLDEENVLIFDLGGGTFDVSLLTLDEGMFEVKATAGNTHLGGEDFDNILLDYFIDDFYKQHKLDIRENPRSMRRLKTACEKIKISLSSKTYDEIILDSLYENTDYKKIISRAKFENLCEDYFKNCLVIVQKVLDDANISKNNIHDIVLVGGSTRIPKIQSLLKNYFNKNLCNSINPDEAVAYGAAIQAAILSGNTDEKLDDILLVDVTPLSLGIETVGGIMSNVIDRNTTIPTKQVQMFTTEDDYQTEMTVDIYEGERTETKYNNHLGSFELVGIKSSIRGVPKLEVTFMLDSNGILSVKAKDLDTNSENSIEINHTQKRLTGDKLEGMLDDAIKNKNKDKLLEKKLEIKEELNYLLYNEEVRDIEQLNEFRDWYETIGEDIENCTYLDYSKQIYQIKRLL